MSLNDARIETVEVTLFGETREIEVSLFGDRAYSRGLVVVGKFPTGTKLHGSSLTLWKRVYTTQAGTERTLRGDTAAVIDGNEYIADFTLYQNNRNTGRI